MKNTYARLLLLKAQLYALLAALGGLLLILVSFMLWQTEASITAFETKPSDQYNVGLPPKATVGKELFLANCAACHNKNMVDDLTGPALVDVEERWAAYPREDLYNWIRHSQQMVRAKHPRAVELWKKWGPVIMNDFSALSDEQIDQILAYVESR